jgi:hypothetical protein
MEKRARASASALRAEIDCEQHQHVIAAIDVGHHGSIDDRRNCVICRGRA